MIIDKKFTDLIQKLDLYFSEKGYPYALIGANVPLFLIDLKEESGKGFGIRQTMDIDFAVKVSDWENYYKLKQDLLELGFVQKENEPEHRFFWNDQIIDIIPYGNNIVNEGFIEWPSTKHRMNVIGYDKLFKHVQNIPLSGRLYIPIIPLSLLVFTKISAYLDRNAGRDLQDILYVFQHYEEVSISERRFDIICDEVSYETAGAFLLGVDLKELLDDSEKGIISEFFNLFEDKYSQTVQQLSRDSNTAAEDIVDIMTAFKKGLQ